jgi:hypothetical protein
MLSVLNIDILGRSGNYIYHLLVRTYLSILTIKYVYVLRVILTTNSDSVCKRH